MNLNKLYKTLLILFFFLICSGLYAMGRQDDSELQKVTGLENWNHSMDINDLPPGEYNIIVRGTDRAGNAGVGGPYNIFIDPSIQIPTVSISTPSAGSRVENLVNVVGTATDDEGIDRVEIAVDEGNYQKIEGTEFWSTTLDCSSWDDGPHTIRVRSWDRERNESPAAEVSFFKDTVKPEIEITSHTNGSYISGRIDLIGTVTDLNGIESAAFSDDGYESLETLRLSKGKEEGQQQFKISIDTKDFEDGAHVYWLEAVDGLGSTAKQSFLYYIDNSPPALSLLYPEPEKTVNGNITLIGMAEDAVGLTGLSFEADNGESGEIAMSPGNPVWTLPLDYNGFKGKAAKVKMLLTDLVGNSVSETFKITLDHEGDLPSPGLSEHGFAALYKSTPVITGLMIDDDGSSGRIEYSLNRGELQSLEVDGPWSLKLDGAEPGINLIEVRAVDKNGLAGVPVVHELLVAQPEPTVVIDSHFINEQQAQWYPGIVLDSKNPGLLSGTYSGPADMKLSWSLNGGEIKNLPLGALSEDGTKTFDIKLPRNMESGRMLIEVFGLDETDAEFSTETVYYNYLQPEVEEGAQVPDFIIPDSKGLQLIMPGKRAASFIKLDSGRYIGGWTPDAEIKSVELSGGTDFLKVETSGNSFILSSKAEGLAEGVIITVKLKNGKELVSSPMNIVADLTPPDVKAEGLKPAMIVGDELVISAEAVDNTGAVKLYYSLDGGKSFTALKTAETELEGDTALFSESLRLTTENESLVDLVLKGEDLFGNESFIHFPLLRDSRGPEIEFITASFERGAEQITWSGKVIDGDDVESLVVSFLPPAADAAAEADVAVDAEAEGKALVEDAEIPAAIDFPAVLNDGIFYLDVNLTSLGFAPSEVLIKATDEAGNLVEIERSLNVDLNEGRPLVGIQVPQNGDAFETGFNLSGLILDKEGVKSVQYSLNGGPFTESGSGNMFTLPLRLEQMLDNENTVSIKAVDINGLESDLVSRNFLISLEPPEVAVNYPDLDAVIRGTISLKGSSSDVNGIKSIWVSHDNGITFQKAEGQEEWTYLLDTRLFYDGVSSLLIKAFDNAGVTGYYTTLINVDNKAPDIKLSRPADGEKIRSTLQLSGRAVDSSGLNILKVYLSPLNKAVEPEEELAEEIVHDIESRGTLLEEIDLSDLTPGTYSFRAEAVDKADNISTVSRIIHILPDEIRPPVFLSPLPGEELGPRFSIQGYLPDYSSKVMLLVDGEVYQTIEVGLDGYFRYDITPEEKFPAGNVKLTLRIEDEDGLIESEDVSVNYSIEGVWVFISNLSQNSYVSDHFVIEGNTGYEADVEDLKMLEQLQPKKVRFSLDGGKTFEQLRVKDGNWKYTLYSEEVPDGELHILVDAVSGEERAYSRCRVEMDTKEPELRLFTPEENAKIYGELVLSGSADDEDGLTDVSLSFREGGKDSYETPSFIQGMYFDASGLGATYFTTGLGLTFMDDNVKLQFQYGYAPTTVLDPDTGLERSARFGGNVFGGKLLANLAQIPFSWLFGPELSAFSATAALGANFSYFSSNAVDDEDSWGVILAGLVGQIELPKISFEDRSFLKYVSVYWEGQLWLISSDVSPEVILLPSIGVRLGLF